MRPPNGTRRGEVRAQVRELAHSAYLAEWTEDVLSRDATVDELKIAEYALLVEPITNAVARLLDVSPQFRKRKKNRVNNMVKRTSKRLQRYAFGEVTASPLRNLTVEVCERRARLVSDRFAKSIHPLDQTLRGASLNAVNSTYSVAVATALTAEQAGAAVGRPRAEFLDLVKSSIQLPLSRPLVHLGWNRAVAREIDAYNLMLADSYMNMNRDLLSYDPAKQRVVLGQPLDRLVNSEAVADAAELQSLGEDLPTVGALDTEDVRIGCPVSFDPDLVVGFYEYMVDLTERHQAWPRLHSPSTG